MARPKNKARLEGIKLGLAAGMSYHSLANLYNITEGRISQIVAYNGLPGRAKRRAQHGGLHRYRMGCRCEPCVAAYKEYYETWSETRKTLRQKK